MFADAGNGAQALVGRAERLRAEAEPVHAGIHLEVDVDRAVELGIFQHGSAPRSAPPVDIVRPAAGRPASNHPFQQQDRLDPAQFAQAQRIIGFDQGQAVGCRKAPHAALFQAMAIGIRLDHAPGFRAGRTGARTGQIVLHGGEMDDGGGGAWHGRGNGSKEKPGFYLRGLLKRGLSISLESLLSWYKATHTQFLEPRMNRGFYTIMAAQFFSSLADNALLFVAIDLLTAMKAPGWITPLLKCPVCAVLCAAGCIRRRFCRFDAQGPRHVHRQPDQDRRLRPALLNRASAGRLRRRRFGAAVYSPAKYGILTELLPAEKLVMANGWIEGLTVCRSSSAP
jgi:hypothetical protein